MAEPPRVSHEGRRLQHGRDGTWLEFTATSGARAAIDLTAYAECHKEPIRSTILRSCEDRRTDGREH